MRILLTSFVLLLSSVAFAPEPPQRAPLRETAAWSDVADKLDGVLTLQQLGTLDQRVATVRLHMPRATFVGRSNMIGGDVEGNIMVGMQPLENGCRLALADLDGVVYHQVTDHLRQKGTGWNAPFSRLSLSPDREMIAIYPSQYIRGLSDAPMFDDYKHDFQQGYLGTDHIVYVYNTDGERLNRYIGYIEPTWTPDGKVIMAGVGDKVPAGLYEADPVTDEVKRIDPERILGIASDPVVSPDGKSIAFSYQSQIWAIERDGTNLRQLVRDPEFDLIFPTWSPDGKFIAYLKRSQLSVTSAVYVIELADPKREYFHDLRRRAPTGDVQLFEPWGAMSWDAE